MQRNQRPKAGQPAKKTKTSPKSSGKVDFRRKPRLKGREKVAVRNATRNKLIKKYGLLAYKHQNESL